MTEPLQTMFSSIEAKAGELLGRVDSMPEETRQRAEPGQWSPQQVVEHLVHFEEEYQALTASVPDDAAFAAPTIKGRVFVALLGGLMRSGLPVPTLPQFEPGTPDALPSLHARWRQALDTLRTRLDAVPDGKRGTFLVHPIAGPLTAEQVLRVTDAHLFYHLHHKPFRGGKVQA